MEYHDLHPNMEKKAWVAIYLACCVLHGFKCGSPPNPFSSSTMYVWYVSVLHDLMLQVWNFPPLYQYVQCMVTTMTCIL